MILCFKAKFGLFEKVLTVKVFGRSVCRLRGLGVVAVIGGLALPAAGVATGTERISESPSGEEANGGSIYGASISANGRYVAFSSYASNLVSSDDNGGFDVFVRDRLKGSVERVTVDIDGDDSDSEYYPNHPRISANGRYVVFYSSASDLIEGDDNGESDLFIRDLYSDTTERISIDSTGDDPDGESYGGLSMSSDARYIAFTSEASDLVTGDDNGVQDVFLYDRSTGTTELVSINSTGSGLEGESSGPSVSNDGRYVAFSTITDNVVDGVADSNGKNDVYLYDREDDQVELISQTTEDVAPTDSSSSGSPSINGNGRYILFSSYSNELVEDDDNGKGDNFLYDRQRDEMKLISRNPSGNPANGISSLSGGLSISKDGRWMVFYSKASDLVTDDTNGMYDVFLYNADTDKVTRVSVDTDGGDADADSYYPSISPTGRYIVYNSDASDLIDPADSNYLTDAFFYDQGSVLSRTGPISSPF